MKWVRAAYIIFGILLIFISCGIYWFGFKLSNLEYEQLNGVPRSFWGFFSTRAFYWYIVVNAPAIVGIVLFFCAPKTRPRRV